MVKKITALVALGLAVGLGTSAVAADITALNGTQGWATPGTTSGSSVSISAEQPRNGDASLKLTTAPSGKAVAGALINGTLGQLKAGQISFDFFRDAASTMTDFQSIACKFYVSNAAGQSGSIIWERCYNTNNGAVAEGQWYDNYDITSDKFWIRSSSYNFAQVANMKTLADWAAGGTVSAEGKTSIALGDDTRITGIEFSVGSGLPGVFIGYMDDVNVQFAGGNTYNYNFENPAVPEPASVMLGIMGLGSVLGLRRFRK